MSPTQALLGLYRDRDRDRDRDRQRGQPAHDVRPTGLLMTLMYKVITHHNMRADHGKHTGVALVGARLSAGGCNAASLFQLPML